MGTPAGHQVVKSRIEGEFPSLASAAYKITSPATPEYNCIAWAASDNEAWWWPDEMGQYYWPPGVPRRATLEAFAATYALLGFAPCPSGGLEPGCERVAVYVDDAGTPTHAARQVPDGTWTSKLGMWEDIMHAQVEQVEGRWYGTVALFMKRPL